MKHKIVLVPFPFDDLSSTKVRPAICLTEPLGEHKHVVLAFITSRVQKRRFQPTSFSQRLVKISKRLACESLPLCNYIE